MKKAILLTLVLAFVSLTSGRECRAQQSGELLDKVAAENRSTIEALVLYPEEIRKAILEACTHPECIARLSAIGAQSRKAFNEMIAPHPREIQQQIWELARYPVLIDKLAVGGKKSQKKVKTILRDFPQEIHPIVYDLSENNYSLLVELNKLNETARSSLLSITTDYPPETRKAFEKLINYPDVLSVLQDHMTLSVIVGSAYQEDPDALKKKGSALRQQIYQTNSLVLREWKNTLEKNPQVLDEYKASTQAFAKETGHDSVKAKAPVTTDLSGLAVAPYPYWIGYPGGRASDAWYPYPAWHYWGYHYDEEGAVVIFGMPSFEFTDWYFASPGHFSTYPSLTDQFIRVHERYPDLRNGFHEAVFQWYEKNRDKIPGKWLKDDASRAARLAEFGQFEKSFESYMRANPGTWHSRQKYLKDNAAKYPALSAVEKPSTQVYTLGLTQQTHATAKGTDGNSKVKLQQPNELMRLNQAQDYHHGTWNAKTWQRLFEPGMMGRGRDR
ncbi:hypothetical protein ACFLU6_09410 [Acidobacteriota bacterium]